MTTHINLNKVGETQIIVKIQVRVMINHTQNLSKMLIFTQSLPKSLPRLSY